ncbi:MAG: AAA family ATPase [Mycoplasmatales bacterium]
MKTYQVGVVSGKFRLLHKAHKEVLIRATLENIKSLVVIIHDNETIHRYSTLEELRVSIGTILKDTHMPYKIIVCQEIFPDIITWENFVIEQIGHQDILMFNSKEDYENITLDNKFIHCKNLKTISVTEIEKNPYDIEFYEKVAKEFMPYINKKIVISGVESSGKTQLAIKLSKILNTIYSPECGRGYAREFLGADDEAFTPKDFVFIAQNQLAQDRKLNKAAHRTLIVDTDPFVTLRFLYAYHAEYIKRGIITQDFEKEFTDAISMLETICKTYKSHLIFLLQPNNEFTSDGIRWDNQTQAYRKAQFNDLKKIYDKFGHKYIIVKGDTYSEKFEFMEKEIEKIMNIY